MIMTLKGAIKIKKKKKVKFLNILPSVYCGVSGSVSFVGVMFLRSV